MDLLTQDTGILPANGGQTQLSWEIDPVVLGLAPGTYRVAVGGYYVDLLVRSVLKRMHVTVTLTRQAS
jgi:hypothetical protein